MRGRNASAAKPASPRTNRQMLPRRFPTKRAPTTTMRTIPRVPPVRPTRSPRNHLSRTKSRRTTSAARSVTTTTPAEFRSVVRRGGEQFANLVVGDLMKVDENLSHGFEIRRHRRADHVVGLLRQLLTR